MNTTKPDDSGHLLTKAELCSVLRVSLKTLKLKLRPIIDELGMTPEEYRRIKMFGVKESLHIRTKLGIS